MGQLTLLDLADGCEYAATELLHDYPFEQASLKAAQQLRFVRDALLVQAAQSRPA